MARGDTKTRKRYTRERRAEILATAEREKLSASGVQKRFGVIPVTYYSWRKNAKGGPAKKRRAPRAATSKGSLREAVRAKLERQLPKIVDQEVDRYLKSVFGAD